MKYSDCKRVFTSFILEKATNTFAQARATRDWRRGADSQARLLSVMVTWDLNLHEGSSSVHKTKALETAQGAVFGALFREVAELVEYFKEVPGRACDAI
jgi:hypothetical protein